MLLKGINIDLKKQDFSLYLRYWNFMWKIIIQNIQMEGKNSVETNISFTHHCFIEKSSDVIFRECSLSKLYL